MNSAWISFPLLNLETIFDRNIKHTISLVNQKAFDIHDQMNKLANYAITQYFLVYS